MNSQPRTSRRLGVLLIVVLLLLTTPACKQPMPETKTAVETEDERIIQLLESGNRDDVEAGLELIDEHYPIDKHHQLPSQFMPSLIKLLQNDDERISLLGTSIIALGAYHEWIGDTDIPLVVTGLAEALGNLPRYYRREASKALGLLGPRARDAMPALRKQFESSDDEYFRWHCAVSMDMIEPGSMQDVIFMGLRDPDASFVIVGGLCRYGLNPSTDPARIRTIVLLILDALPNAIERYNLAPEGDWESKDVLEELEFALVLYLERFPETIDLYEDYLGKGIDPYIERIIAEANAAVQTPDEARRADSD